VTVFFLAGVRWRKLGNGDSAPRDLNGLAFRSSLEQLIEVSFGVERTYGFHAFIISWSQPVDQLVCSHGSRKLSQVILDVGLCGFLHVDPFTQKLTATGCDVEHLNLTEQEWFRSRYGDRLNLAPLFPDQA
jgi:hypothetical protein